MRVSPRSLRSTRELGFAPDEARELHRQNVREVVDRSQRREGVAELGVHELVDVFGPAEVLQPVHAEVAQRPAFGQPVTNELARRLRQHDLAAVPGIAQAGGAVQCGSDVVALVSELDLAGVDAHAQPKRVRARAVVGSRARRRPRPTHARERGDEAVTLALLDRTHALVPTECGVDHLAERFQRAGHLLGALLPAASGALDVGQEQRDRATGQDELAPIVHRRRIPVERSEQRARTVHSVADRRGHRPRIVCRMFRNIGQMSDIRRAGVVAAGEVALCGGTTGG